MALNQTLTPEIIHATADQLQSEGIKPTLANLRDRLGGGSFTTIGQAMKSWRTDQTATAQLAKVVIPDDLKNRLNLLGAELWETAQSYANDQLATERETLAHKEALLLAEVEEYKTALTTLESEQNDLTTQLDDLTGQLAMQQAEFATQIKTHTDTTTEQQNAISELKTALATTQGENTVLRDQVKDLKTQIEQLMAILPSANKAKAGR